MKKLRYSDDMGGWAKVITLTREEAIQHQRQSYLRWKEIHPSYVELDEEELLQDFIAINWAYWVDDEEDSVKKIDLYEIGKENENSVLVWNDGAEPDLDEEP